MYNQMNNRQLQKEFRNSDLYKSIEEFKNPVAITLTFESTNISQDKAKANMEVFIKKLSHKVFKSAYRKHKKLVNIFPVLEGGLGTDTHYHYHCIIERPSHIEYEDFEIYIAESWKATNRSNPRITIEPAYDSEGYLDYITKLCSKNNFMDAIDVENMNSH